MRDKIRNAVPFIVSVGIHSTLVAATFLIAQEEETPKVKQSQVAISLSSYTPIQQALADPTSAKPEPKKVPKKVIKKEIPKKVVKKKIVKKKVVKKEVIKKEVVKKEVVKKEEVTPQQVVKEEIVPPAEAFAPQVSNEVAPVEEEQKLSRAPQQEEPLLDNTQQTTQKQISPEIDPTTLGLIRSMIQNSLIYPSMARRLKIEGVVNVAFTLTRDGRVKSAVIEETSGSSSLDSKALDTVLGLSGTYPKLQKEMQLKIPIAFSLKQI